ncbi:hypothetical protein ACIBAC_00045 [Streptomyces sp. NPDC051362]|uniref:hypothetical protein n=1 Tax=Streptomyces sp. NPDC051362 TaxID=3365651 RepID=UPI003792429F
MSGKHVIQAGQWPLQGRVELLDEADPIVHVQDPYDPNKSVGVRRSSLQPTAPTPQRDLTPQPLLDVTAQRMIGGGVGLGVAAWGAGHLFAGISQLLAAATGFATTIASIVFMIVVARIVAALRKPRTVNVKNVNVLGGRSITKA